MSIKCYYRNLHEEMFIFTSIPSTACFTAERIHAVIINLIANNNILRNFYD